MKNFNLFKNGVIFLLIMGVALVSGTAMGGEAQPAPAEGEFILEEIVITGSRIVRRDFEANSPIITVDEELFDQSATLAIETQLNKLPQFIPTIDVPTTGGDIQPTARNTPGEATVALRGIGMNRTLVLINGRRGTPSNAMGIMDINTIPTAAIQRVEAISGGASSTYGADAMAGVLNFIMKDKFVGMEVDAQMGMTQEGDNLEYQVSGVIGADIADDRGNVMMAFSYNRRDDARQEDRSWYREQWADPHTSMGNQFFFEYTGFNVGYSNLPTVAALNANISGATFTTSSMGMTYYSTQGINGQVFTGDTAAGQPGKSGAFAAGIVDGYHVKEMSNGNLGYVNTRNYLIFPMYRYNIYSQATYEINDWLGVFMQAYFSKVSTNTVQEPGPITSGWSVNIYPQYNRAVIPADLLAILDSRANPNGAVSLRAMLPVPRETITDTTTFSVIAGLEGKIPGIDWTWELFTSHGEAQTYAQSIGYTSLKRTKMVIGGYYTQMRLNAAGQPVDQFGNVVTDPSAAKWDEITLPGYKNFGQGFRMKANPEDGGFGAATATCTSGLNPFDYSGMTPDCWDAIKADVKTRMLTEQDIFELNLQGGIIDLPAGEMRGAIGASERLNEFKFLSDNINSERQSFNDTILGLYPAQDSIGSLEVKEYYGELLVPVLKDIPFVKALNLELGARSSDYDTTGKSRTYKALADWRILDWIRFRGGYNKAERAPNIAELYLNPEQTFGVMSYGDVCSVRNRVAPVTANPDFNDEWYEVVKICGQLMDKVGTDLDVTYYYKQNWETIYNYGVANPGATGASLHGPDTNANGLPDDGFLMTDTAYNDGFYQTTGGFGFLWPINVGNDELGPETANTWTAGIVFDSPFEHPALSNFRVSIDWYQIAIKDAIGEQSADMVMMMCVDPAFNPGYDINNYSCQGMNRDPRFGTLGQVVKSFYNGGEFETSGIDVNINYSLDLGPGTFMWNTNFNWLLDKSSTQLAGVLASTDYTGTMGPNENGLQGNSYKYRAMTTFGYLIGKLNASIRWQWYASIDQAGVALGRVTTTGAPPYSLFDLLGNYALTDNLRLRFGVENVLNTEPPLVGVLTSAADGMTGGMFMPGVYDTNGRRFYAGIRWEF